MRHERIEESRTAVDRRWFEGIWWSRTSCHRCVL